MATHEGHNKTAALAPTAAASLPPCFIDPSGVSQGVFLAASAGTVVGVTAHECKVFRRTKAILVHHREKRETTISISTDACKPVGSDDEHETTITSTRTDAKPVGSDGEHAFTQHEFEECIRKLASSLTGVVISGTMSIVLPHHLIGTAMNAAETAWQWHRLRKMTQQAGGGAGLARNVSKLDISLQITAGICIKLLTSGLSLGEDSDVWVDAVSTLSDAVVTVVDTGALPTGPGQTAQLAESALGQMIDHGVLASTTALANALTNLVGDLLGDGTKYTPLIISRSATGLLYRKPIELKVPMCCEKCACKVRDRLLRLNGVESVIADQYNQKVVVTGNVDPAQVLSQVKLVKKESAFWDMTVDYSQAYHKMRRARDMALAAEQAARKNEAAKASAAPAAGPNVVVKLPKEENGPNVQVVLPPEPTVKVPAKEKGPNVTVILPESEAKENRVPYQASWGTQRQRYASPPKGYRQELYYGPREEYYRGYDERPSAFRGQFNERPHGFQGEFPAPRPEHFSPYRNY